MFLLVLIGGEIVVVWYLVCLFGIVIVFEGMLLCVWLVLVLGMDGMDYL